ncbi:MAG: MFS transporter [Polyangiales bacterium]
MGVPISGSGLLQTELGLSATQLTLALFTLPSAFALLVEPPLMIWASRRPPGRVIAVALGAVGLGALLTAHARSFGALLVALLVWYPAIGIATVRGEAALMDAEPDQRARNLTRWTLAGTVGDLAAPGLLALSLKLGASHRGALVVVTLIAWAAAIRLWRLSPPHATSDDDDEPSLRRALATLLGNRRLALWMIGAALCDLMDETLVALAALRVQARFGGDATPLTVVLGALTASAVVGLSAADWLLARVPARRLLALASLTSLVAFTLFLLSFDLPSMAASAFLVGASASLHHPLAQSEAYAALPHDAGMVATLGTFFGVSFLISPPLLGWAADTHGLTAALALLLAQPVGLLVVLALTHRSG